MALDSARVLWIMVVSGLAVSAMAAKPQGSKPHLVIALADDMGYHLAGFMGNPYVQTPTLDRLALQEGTQLHRHYTEDSCGPSRVAMLTGRYYPHSRPAGSYEVQGAHSHFTLLPEKLRSAGYRNHFSGKWDLGMQGMEFTPTRRGFETALFYFNSGEYHYSQVLQGASWFENCPGYETIVDLWDGCGPAKELNGTAYGDDHFVQRAVDTVEAHDPSEPLFLYLALQVMHTPSEVPVEYLSIYMDAPGKAPPGMNTTNGLIEYAMASYADHAISRVVGAIQAKGMWNDTLMLFSSDNGGSNTDSATSNYPLRGSKSGQFDGGIRVPAFVTGGFLPSSMYGTRIDHLVYIADWYATFCGLAGVDPDDTDAAGVVPPTDSVDQWPMLSGASASPARTELFSAYYYMDNSSLTNGLYKLIAGQDTDCSLWDQPYYPAGNDESDVIYLTYEDIGACDCNTVGSYYLFDLAADPRETTDLSDQLPHIRDLLVGRYEALVNTSWYNYEGYDEYENGQTVADTCAASAKAGNYLVPPDYWNDDVGFIGPDELVVIVAASVGSLIFFALLGLLLAWVRGRMAGAGATVVTAEKVGGGYDESLNPAAKAAAAQTVAR